MTTTDTSPPPPPPGYTGASWYLSITQEGFNHGEVQIGVQDADVPMDAIAGNIAAQVGSSSQQYYIAHLSHPIEGFSGGLISEARVLKMSDSAMASYNKSNPQNMEAVQGLMGNIQQQENLFENTAQAFQQLENNKTTTADSQNQTQANQVLATIISSLTQVLENLTLNS